MFAVSISTIGETSGLAVANCNSIASDFESFNNSYSLVLDATTLGVSKILIELSDIGSYPSSLNETSEPLILVPEVDYILAITFVPVGVITFIFGVIASNGIF